MCLLWNLMIYFLTYCNTLILFPVPMTFKVCMHNVPWNSLSARNNNVKQYAAQATYHLASVTQVS